MEAVEEAKTWASDCAKGLVEYCVANISEDDDYFEARWMARLSGQSWALARYITQNWDLTGEEFEDVTNAWFDVIVNGLMDAGVIADDRAMVVS